MDDETLDFEIPAHLLLIDHRCPKCSAYTPRTVDVCEVCTQEHYDISLESLTVDEFNF